MTSSTLSIILAGLLFSDVLVHVFLLWRDYRLMSISFIGMLLIVGIYAVLNMEPVERVMNDALPGSSFLIKEILLVSTLFCINATWRAMGFGGKGWAVLRWAIPLLLINTKVLICLYLRSSCDMSATGFSIRNCIGQLLPYMLTDVAVFTCLALWSLVMLTVLWKSARQGALHQDSLLFFGFAFLIGVAWASTMLLGAVEIYFKGHLLEEQFILRPVLSILGGVLLMIALLVMPVRVAVSRFFLHRHLRPLEELVARKTLHKSDMSKSVTTSLMDRISLLIVWETGRDPVADSSESAAHHTALWLLGQQRCPGTIPSRHAVFIQRQWLLRVSQLIQLEREQ